MRAAIPLAIQIVIDDVGWWYGYDGSDRNEPYRTGIKRPHVPADYEAVVSLGRQLGVRPQAALVLCEWDRENLLARYPSTTWNGAKWNNRKWVGPWLDKAGDILREGAAHMELTLHGVGHEFWDEEGRMSRAEWCDAAGHMRPAHLVRQHFDAFFALMEQNGLGPRPISCVPPAGLYRFGQGPGGLGAILREYGIRYLSTPFGMMAADPPLTRHPPEHASFGIDQGVLCLDRPVDWPVPWDAIDHHPSGELSGAIAGLHWPNLLHPDPDLNDVTIQRWVAFFRPYDHRLDRMLAPDMGVCATQCVHHHLTRATAEEGRIELDFTAVRSLPAAALTERVFLKVEAPPATRFTTHGAAILAQRFDAAGGHHVLEVQPASDDPTATIICR